MLIIKDFEHESAFGACAGKVIATNFSIIVSLFDGEQEDTFTYTTMQSGKACWTITSAKVDGSIQIGKYSDRTNKHLTAAYQCWVEDLPKAAQDIVNNIEYFTPEEL